MEIPFVFDKPVSGKFFLGRRSESRTLSNLVTHGQNVVLWGPPKSGKMSVVRQSLYMLQTNKVQFNLCDFSVFNIRNPYVFIRKFAGAVLKVFETSGDDIATLAERFLGGTSLVFDYADYTVTGNVFPGTFPLSGEECYRVFEMPYLIAKEKNTNLLIVLQDFQNMDFGGDDVMLRSLQDAMSAYKDMREPFCSYILVGSKENAMSDIFKKRHFFWNLVERIELSPLSDTEVIEHVLKGFMTGGKVIDRDLVQGVCRRFQNNIWYINHFFFICDSLSKGYISELTLNNALSCMLAIHSPKFRDIMDGLTSYQESLLKAVLDGVVKFSTTDVIERYALNSSANVKRLKDALMKKEVIMFNEKDEPCIQDTLFEYWLRRYYFQMEKI